MSDKKPKIKSHHQIQHGSFYNYLFSRGALVTIDKTQMHCFPDEILGQEVNIQGENIFSLA